MHKFKGYREISRSAWGPKIVDKKTMKQRDITREDLQLGALLRIADALEKHDVLELEKKAGELRKENEELACSIQTRRGLVSRLQSDMYKYQRQINGLKGCIASLNKCVDQRMAKITKKKGAK